MDRLINICTALILLCTGSAVVSAQGGYTVQGSVEDEYGPVIGAAVVEQGTSNGTSTGPDGGFSLTVSGPSALVEISCIGYASQVFEAALVPQTVTLKEDSEYLDEVVVIGYGTVKRRHLSSSVSKVTVDDDAIGSCSNIAEYLMGKVPGLTVFQEGDGYRYQIRGANSFYGSTEPLFLVDGIETDNIDHINPLEVRSVEVLKDGSASIYGTRGANGVIMITTKR